MGVYVCACIARMTIHWETSSSFARIKMNEKEVRGINRHSTDTNRVPTPNYIAQSKNIWILGTIHL